MSIEQTLVSVIVPVYKVEQYLQRCVSSIRRQTHQSLEIILVDDGSPDKCGKICDVLAMEDDRIVVIHQENAGLSAARNVGIHASHGQCLMFVDSDDWIEPDMVHAALKDLETTGADIVVFGFNRVGEDGSLLSVVNAHMPKLLTREEAIVDLFTGPIGHYACNKVYKKPVFDGVEYPLGRYWEDIGTTYRLFHNAEKVYITNRILYNYLSRSASITGNPPAKAVADIFLQRHEQHQFLCAHYPGVSHLGLGQLAESAYMVLNRLTGNQEYTSDVGKARAFLLENRKLLEASGAVDAKIALFYRDERFFARAVAIIGRNESIKKRLKGTMTFLGRAIRAVKRRANNLLRPSDVRDLFPGTEQRRCLIVGTPDHDNLGDHAITLSTIRYIQTALHGYQVADVNLGEYWRYARSLSRLNGKGDLIVLEGGGDLGDMYEYIENIRRDAIRRSRVRTVLFPQTYFFSDTARGRREEKKTQSIYQANPSLILLAREAFSYERMKRAFPGNPVHLLPDIVMRYRPTFEQSGRTGILLVLRSDRESALTLNAKAEIRQICLKYSDDIRETDTSIGESCPREKRESMLREKLSQLASASLIVTDRLHGMVLAALVKTSCIALGNYNDKVRGAYRWFEELNYIEYMDNLDALEPSVARLVQLRDKTPYPYDRFDRAYEVLTRLLEE